jgi:hypothetical protein
MGVGVGHRRVSDTGTHLILGVSVLHSSVVNSGLTRRDRGAERLKTALRVRTRPSRALGKCGTIADQRGQKAGQRGQKAVQRGQKAGQQKNLIRNHKISSLFSVNHPFFYSQNEEEREEVKD